MAGCLCRWAVELAGRKVSSKVVVTEGSYISKSILKARGWNQKVDVAQHGPAYNQSAIGCAGQLRAQLHPTRLSLPNERV